MTSIYDVIFVGAGCANISGAYYLHKNHPEINFLLIDMGKHITERNHLSETDCISGVGGAGLFSDGKFSFYPAGTNVWKLEQQKLKMSYLFLASILKPFIVIPELILEEHSYCPELSWTLKKYKSFYLSLNQRKELIHNITCEYHNEINERFLLSTEVKCITIVKSDTEIYEIKCENVVNKKQFSLCTKKIILSGGRFMPLFLKSLDNKLNIPMEFKRIELGIRFKGPSDCDLYETSDGVDPKFIKYDKDRQIEYRTFCWCRNGETVLTNFKEINTWSGRSDCVPTNSSNFGFNVIFKEEKYIKLLHNAISTSSFETTFKKLDIPETYKETSKYILDGLRSFLNFSKFEELEEFKVCGPTIEGVGYYPITNDDLQIKGQKIWVGGDCTGKFRGIVPSMLSGIFIAIQVAQQHNKIIL